MIDKETLQLMQSADAIDRASMALTRATQYPDKRGLLVLPDSMTPHDIQQYLPTARRRTGTFEAATLASFASYVMDKANVPETEVYVNTEDACARAILDATVGNGEPGHMQHTAELQLTFTAPMKALHCAAAGKISQRDLAEFLETWRGDWSAYIGYPYDDPRDEVAGELDEELDDGRAIAAIRAVTMESAGRIEQEDRALSASRSAFESVSASSKYVLPSFLQFRVAPFAGFLVHTYDVRIRVLLDGDKIVFKLQMSDYDRVQDVVSREFEQKIRDLLPSVSIYFGSYNRK